MLRSHRPFILLLTGAVLLCLLFAGCGQREDSSGSGYEETEISSKSSEERTESITETESPTETETTPESETPSEPEESEPSSEESSEETGSETASSEESSEEETVPEEELFFGRRMDPKIAAVNRITLNDPAAKLFDLTAEEIRFTESGILSMIRSYAFPQRAFYDGEPYSEELEAEILAARGIAEAEENADDSTEESEEAGSESGEEKDQEEFPAEFRYGIFTENADVRSFPTEVKATDSTDEQAFDYFQESMLPIGQGALILHESSDGTWFFVQSFNYFGWVRSDTLALCEKEEFMTYLTSPHFLVFTTPDYVLHDKQLRMATVLPYCDEDEEHYMIDFPVRTEEGRLDLLKTGVRKQEKLISDGYAEYSEEALIRTARKMLNQVYGWGDTDSHYDCSSTVGLIYQCFGFYFPRNTSDMPHFGGTAEDLQELSDEEKLEKIQAHPGAVLVMPGHAMLYAGTDEDGSMRILHNVSRYHTDEGEEVRAFHMVDTDADELFTSDGSPFVSRLTWMLYFDEEAADDRIPA